MLSCLDTLKDTVSDSSDTDDDSETGVSTDKLNINVGDHDIIYLLGHPEDFVQKQTIRRLMMWKWSRFVTHVIVDEAHCIVQWGENFRPKYRQLGELRSVFGDATIVAVTATATIDTQREIAKVLFLAANHKVVRTNIDRNNIKYIIHRRASSVSLGCVDYAYQSCFMPFLEELKMLGNTFPKTVIFTGLKWCGYGHQLARSVLFDQQHLVEAVNQYHAHLPSSVNMFCNVLVQ